MNHESKGAALYWKQLFGPQFTREHNAEDDINKALNYGYAILRAVTARALVSSGLLPALGIFHQNKYNPYVLADDIMEPYRPVVDFKVKKWWDGNGQVDGVEIPMKNLMLQVPTNDVFMEKKSNL